MSRAGGRVNYFDRLDYNPLTGALTWAVSGPGIRKGADAGSISSHGYRVIKLGRKPYRVCRLAWFLVHGVWPEGEIDHINGVKVDDRIANLRVVDRAGNAKNMPETAQVNNHSCGLRGVTWNKQHRRWQSKLMANKTVHHVGYFETPQVAHEAYMAVKRRLHLGGRSH